MDGQYGAVNESDSLTLQAANAAHSIRESSMKYSKALLVTALIAMSGVAFAQAGGGNGNGGNSGNGGSGNGHGAATPAPTAGGDAGSGAMSGGTKMQHTSKSKSTMKPKTKKPMADSTNGGASSDTNAQ